MLRLKLLPLCLGRSRLSRDCDQLAGEARGPALEPYRAQTPTQSYSGDGNLDEPTGGTRDVAWHRHRSQGAAAILTRPHFRSLVSSP